MSTRLLVTLPLLMACAPVGPLVSTTRVTGNVATGHTVRPTHDPCRVTGNLVFRTTTFGGKGGPPSEGVLNCRVDGLQLVPKTTDSEKRSCSASTVVEGLCVYDSFELGLVQRGPDGFTPYKGGS